MNRLTSQQRERFLAQVALPNERGCMLWLGRKRSKEGGANCYGRPSIGGTTRNAHHIAFEIANGQIPEGLRVLHRCDTPLCVNPGHLFLGTQSDNMTDCGAKGRSNKRGNNNGRAILTPEIVRRIRLTATDDRTMKALAVELGVSKSTIYAVASNRNWTHVI